MPCCIGRGPAACALVLAWCACRRAPIASCDDDLRGVYGDGSARWMVLDHGATLEAYPLFADGAAPGAPADVVVAPRFVELVRGVERAAIAGTLHRRYMQRAELCEARVPIHVMRCAQDALELVLADPAPPLAFSPCAWPGAAPSRVVRWRRD